MGKGHLRRRVSLLVVAASALSLIAFVARSQVGQGVRLGASVVDMPDTGVVPPDGGLAASHRHLVAVADGRFRILTKEGTVVRDVSLDAFFTETAFNTDVVLPTLGPGCGAATGTFGPRALFDQVSNRFFVLGATGARLPAKSRYLLAVSRSPDPTDGFCCYDFNGSGYVNRRTFVPETTWADYPTLGVDDVAVFFGSNQMSGDNFVRSRMNWLDKSPLLGCEPPDVLFGYADFRHDAEVAVDQAFSIQPAHSFGPTDFIASADACASDADCGGGACTFEEPSCLGSGKTCASNADCGTCPEPTCAHNPARTCDPLDPDSCGSCEARSCAQSGLSCNADADCGKCLPPTPSTCSDGANQGSICQTDADCGTCHAATCTGSGAACNVDADCGTCQVDICSSTGVGCASNADCGTCETDLCSSTGVACAANTDCGSCVRTCAHSSNACQQDADCGDCLPIPILPDICSASSTRPGLLGCSADSDCGTCSIGDCTISGASCLVNADCGTCLPHACTFTGNPCGTNADCGQCLPRACTGSGAECATNTDCGACRQRFCDDGLTRCDSDTDCGTCGLPQAAHCMGSTSACTADADCGTCLPRTCSNDSADTHKQCTADEQCGTCPSRTCSADSPDPDQACDADTDCGICQGVCQYQSEFLAATFVSQGDDNDAVTVWRIVDPLGTDWAGSPTFFIEQETVLPPHIDAFDNPPAAKQPGSCPGLNTGDARLLNLVWRSPGNMWTSHNGADFDCDGEQCAALLLKEFGTRNFPDLTVPHDFSFGEDNFSYLDAAIAVLEGNQVAVGFTRTGASPNLGFPSAAFTGRLQSTSTTGNVLGRPSVVFGGACYQPLTGAAVQPWGDYHGASAEVCPQKGAWVEGQASVTGATYETRASNVFGDPAPGNNVCGSATEIKATDLPFTEVLDTTFATFEEVDRDVQSECGSISYPGNDGSVWYEFRAPRNGDLTIDTSGSNYGTVLSVHHETGECSGLGEVACEVCEKLYSISPRDAVLRQIDVDTGATLDTIPLTAEPVPQAMYGNVFGGVGLATSPVTGQLFSLICFDDECNSDGDRLLSTIDVHSGLVTVIGDPDNDHLTHLAFARDGTLFAVDKYAKLYELSSLDATLDLLCDVGPPAATNIAFDPVDSLLYFTDDDVSFERIDDTSVNPCGTTPIDVSATPLATDDPRALTYWESAGVFIWAQADAEDKNNPSKLFHVTAAGEPIEVGTTLDHETRGLAFVKCGPGDPGTRTTVPLIGGETYRIVVSECGLATCGGDKFLHLEVDFAGGVCGSLGQACDDLNACTTGDQCRTGSGAVLECRGTSILCSDPNVCTTDSCNPATGCVFTNNTAACDDGNACTTNDRCNAGQCESGPARDCIDSNLCTTDSCNTATGCVHTPNANPCNDGNACTPNDRCSNGTCTGGPAITCNDNNQCTTDPTCNSATGCVFTARTGSCDDGNKCTTNDACVSAQCVGGSPTTCNDGNVCTNDSCNPFAGCEYTANTASCSDGVFCNGIDTCANKECVHAGDPCLGNDFCSNVCNEAADNCFRPDETDCSDGKDCTLSDRCLAGVCVGDSPCPTGQKCVEELEGQCVPCVGVSQVQTGGGIRCGINRPCGLPVRLETNGVSNAFGLVAQESVAQMPLHCSAGACKVGPAGGSAVCDLNNACSFFLFQSNTHPDNGFKSGTVAEVPVTCMEPGAGSLALNNLQLSDGDGDLIPLCNEQPNAVFTCDDCLEGDCIANGKLAVNDAICVLWCGLQSTLRLQAEGRGWDCTCAADCNCDGVTNVVDALCALHRLINNGQIPGVDRCQGAAANLVLAPPERAYEPVKVRVSATETPEGSKRRRAFVSLARRGAEQVAAIQANVQAVGGDVVKVRLVKRLRDAGFTLVSGQDGSLAEFAIMPPAVQPFPAAGGGRLVRVLVSDETDAVAVAGVELASTAGDLVPTE